LQKDQLP